MILEAVGLVAATLAVVGVLLNNHRYRGCFLVWLVSNALTAGLHAHAGMIALLVRDLIFFALAGHGWWWWGRHKGNDAA